MGVHCSGTLATTTTTLQSLPPLQLFLVLLDIIIMFLKGFPQSIHAEVCNISCGAVKNAHTSIHPFATQKLDQDLLH